MPTPRLPALAFALSLSACASLVPSTAARLAALDPTTADPAQIEVALILPPGLQITPGGAVMTLSARRGDQTLGDSFTLEPRPAPGVDAPPGATVVGFGLAPADLARMRALQARIAAWKAEGKGQGALSVGLGGCAVSGGPSPDGTGAVLIRLADNSPFRPLIRPTPLSQLLGPDVIAAIQPCSRAE